jgi:hypothetical protein
MRSVGRDNVTHTVCEGIHSLNRELDNKDEKDFISTTDLQCTSVIKSGQKRINELYSLTGDILCPQIYSMLCGSRFSQRTVRVAVSKTLQQLHIQQDNTIEYLREYAHRKLREVREAKEKRFLSLSNTVSETTVPTESVTSPVDVSTAKLVPFLSVDKMSMAVHDKLIALKTIGVLRVSGSVSGECLLTLEWRYSVQQLPIIWNILNILSTFVVFMLPPTEEVNSRCESDELVNWFLKSPVSSLCHLLDTIARSLRMQFSFVNSTVERCIAEVSTFVLHSLPYWICTDMLLLDLKSDVGPPTNDMSLEVMTLEMDFVVSLVHSRLITPESLLRIVNLVSRDKTISFYANCRGLSKMTGDLVNRGLQVLFLRIANVVLLRDKSLSYSEALTSALDIKCADFAQNLRQSIGISVEY